MIDMTLPTSDPPHQQRRRLPPWARRTLLFVALGLVGLGGGIALAGLQPQPMPPEEKVLSDALLSQVSFAVHPPRELPAGYKLEPGSARVDEGALVYAAVNSAGQRVLFTEQAKPAQSIVDTFQRENMLRSEKLPHTPYESVVGGATTQGSLLSVTTQTTWLIISATAPDAPATLRFIAEHL